MFLLRYLARASSPPGKVGGCSTKVKISSLGGGGGASPTQEPLLSSSNPGSIPLGSPSIVLVLTALSFISSTFGGSSSGGTSASFLITGGVNCTEGFAGGGGAGGGGGGGGVFGSSGNLISSIFICSITGFLGFLASMPFIMLLVT